MLQKFRGNFGERQLFEEFVLVQFFKHNNSRGIF